MFLFLRSARVVDFLPRHANEEKFCVRLDFFVSLHDFGIIPRESVFIAADICNAAYFLPHIEQVVDAERDYVSLTFLLFVEAAVLFSPAAHVFRSGHSSAREIINFRTHRSPEELSPGIIVKVEIMTFFFSHDFQFARSERIADAGNFSENRTTSAAIRFLPEGAVERKISFHSIKAPLRYPFSWLFRLSG